MAAPHAEVAQIIDARPEVVYGILADYHNSHPHILPKPEFADLVVAQGGTGAGTIVHVTMKVMGSTQTLRMRVTEPQPGKILQEEDTASGVVTTFTVTPLEGGARSQVTITSEWKPKPGIGGFIEGKLVPMVARGLYKKELDLLAAYVKKA